MEFSEITPNVKQAVYSTDGKLIALTNGKKLIVIYFN